MQAESRVWVDAGGSRTVTLVRTTTGAGAISAAVLAASEADWLQSWESAVATNTPVPVGGTYLPVSLRAALTFLCADNTLAVLYIPAPNVSIFLADGRTVDPLNLAVVAIITAAVGTLVSASGSPAVSYVSGVLQRGAAQVI